MFEQGLLNMQWQIITYIMFQKLVLYTHGNNNLPMPAIAYTMCQTIIKSQKICPGLQHNKKSLANSHSNFTK